MNIESNKLPPGAILKPPPSSASSAECNSAIKLMRQSVFACVFQRSRHVITRERCTAALRKRRRERHSPRVSYQVIQALDESRFVVFLSPTITFPKDWNCFERCIRKVDSFLNTQSSKLSIFILISREIEKISSLFIALQKLFPAEFPAPDRW